MACDECQDRNLAMYERCQQLREQRNAAIEALRLHHDDGMDGALLMRVAETLQGRAKDLKTMELDAGARWYCKLADQLTEKHNAACDAIAKAEGEQ